MKRFLVLWLLMASCLPVSVLSQGTCANKNHMLGKLAGAGVTIYQTPKKNNEFCKEEWTSAGTCCEPSSAGSAMKRKADKNLLEVKEMIREIESLPKAVYGFHIEVMSSVTLQATAKKSIQEKYDQLVDYISSQRKVIGTSHSLCINKLNQITRASTCNICSGRSQLFFKGKKILMKEGDCREIIGDCEEAWRGVVKILDLLKVYTTQVKKSYRGELDKEHFDNLQSLDRKHNLSSTFKKCPSLQYCDSDSVSEICENLVSILTPSYADRAATKLAQAKRKLKGWRKFVDALKKIGKAIKKAAKAVGKGVKKAAKAIGKGVKKAAKAVGKGFKKVGKGLKKVGKGFKKIGKSIGKAFKKLGRRRKRKNKNKIKTQAPKAAPAPKKVAKQVWSVAKKINPIKALKKARKNKRKGRKLQYSDSGNGNSKTTGGTGSSTGEIAVANDACTNCPRYDMGDSP